MSDLNERTTNTKLSCYHCGDFCPSGDIKIDEKFFCCNGCKTVYEILNENNLCNYYNIEQTPGISQKKNIKRNYDFLLDESLKNELIDFTDGKITKVTFSIPSMHCSSCIWVLENLYKLDSGITESKVDFLKKILSIQYLEDSTNLKSIVSLLDSIGYEPNLNLEGKKEEGSDHNKKLLYKIGVAGFAFGNIMLLSFPEYLSLSDFETTNLKEIFSYLNIALALPVFLYSGSEYFVSAFKGLKKRIVNIDVPISLGITVLFVRSVADILSQNGPGYLDSLAALVFLLLAGRLFQNKTYETLNFERNYKSYFPLAVTIRKKEKETTKPVSKLEVGDRIIIKSNELVPADSVLLGERAYIDYSFVTGEANPIEKVNGDLIYAGGRQIGHSIEVETIKEVSQSYLTQLWNNKIFDKNYESRLDSLVNIVSKYFTIIIISIASLAALLWLPDFDTAFNSFTAVLIIACPCALALSTPFTLGNSLRIFGRNGFYLKNTNIIERLANITNIVFDKTGTITESLNADVTFTGEPLNDTEKIYVKSLVASSTHPLSGAIAKNYSDIKISDNIEAFDELPGQGIHAIVNGNDIKIGSKLFISKESTETNVHLNTKVYLSLNNNIRGFYIIKNRYRKNLEEIVNNLKDRFGLAILSGDNDSEESELAKIFPETTEMFFQQSPHDKLKFIEKLQVANKSVLMFGDGLNDAGALKQSDAGISISEDINHFSPSCDGILDAKSFFKLNDFIKFCRTSKKIIIISFIISFLYNAVGIFFAVQGLLSPVIAAILMPLSSISVVLFTTVSTNIIAKKKGLL